MNILKKIKEQIDLINGMVDEHPIYKKYKSSKEEKQCQNIVSNANKDCQKV